MVFPGKRRWVDEGKGDAGFLWSHVDRFIPGRRSLAGMRKAWGKNAVAGGFQGKRLCRLQTMQHVRNMVLCTAEGFMK